MLISYKGFTIEMKGLNHFECKKLSMYGYASLSTLKRQINKHIKKGELTK